MKPFDCVVIGAGPAGATAAYHLARLGRSVAVLERQKLPRYKPCGGGVSPEVQSWFDFDLEPAVSWRATRMRATWRMKDAVEGDIPNASVWMVRREVFDHFLVEKAAGIGATVFDGLEATGLSPTEGGWRIETGREPLDARCVIAADGSKGQASKWLGFTERKRRLAGAFEAEANLVKGQDGVIHLEFGMIRGGYLWNFPKSDAHSIGIGAFKGDAPKNMKALLGDYCGGFGIDLASAAQHGHPVAVWNGAQRLHGRSCLLAGEAACLVDPFTAEGIRAAILSGKLAAEAIHEALRGDSLALARYSYQVHERHGKDMAWARRVSALFYAFPKVGYDFGVKDPSALAFMGKLLTGEARYRDIARDGLAKLRGGLAARGRRAAHSP